MTTPITPSEFQQRIFGFVKDRAPAKKHGIVNAVAGSGKTTTLELASKLLPVDGLFCAFNKHIAESLAKRLNGRMRATTIHSIGMSALYSGLGTRPQVDDSKYWTIIREYMLSAPRDLKAEDKAVSRLNQMVRFARLTLTDYTDLDRLLIMANRYGVEWSDHIAAAVAPIIDRGRLVAKETGMIDFTDMLSLPHYLNLRPRSYPFVFVDECQDLSSAGLELVMKCIQSGGRSLWVGDPCQSIMQFAGADSQSYAAIRERTDAVELPLSICYRCPTTVINLARDIVPHIQARPNAPAGAVRQVNEDALLGAREGDLIMSRRNAPLVKHCLRLIRKGVQARVRGRDIGEELADTVNEIGGRLTRYFDLPHAVEKYRTHHTKLLDAANARDDQFEMLADTCDAILECFTGFSDCKSVGDLARKIESIFSDVNAAIWFSSVHRAKGLEADRTFILGYDSLGRARASASVEQAQQERNLKYVSITRAKAIMHKVS